MANFDVSGFESKVSKALTEASRILDLAKHPEMPSDVPHVYDDKYLLAEYLVRIGSKAVLNVLETLGLKEKGLRRIREWAKSRSVTMRLKVERKCTFLREETKEVEDAVTKVTTMIIKKTEKTFTKVTEYFWEFQYTYELFLFKGNDLGSTQTIVGRSGTDEIKTNSKSTPYPEVAIPTPVDLNITWLLQLLDDNHVPNFHISRSDPKCHTPSNNPQILEANSFFSSLYQFQSQAYKQWQDLVSVKNYNLSIESINTNELFDPVVPLFDATSQQGYKGEVGSGAVPMDQIEPFLAYQTASFAAKLKALEEAFPSDSKLVTFTEAKNMTLVRYLSLLASSFDIGIRYIERMLWDQLVAAVGKILTPSDFTNYTNYHFRKIYKKRYQPTAFSYAVRRPLHSPEGVVSIMVENGAIPEPLPTLCSHAVATRPMRFALDAATDVRFLGDRFLHGVTTHQFSETSGASYFLNARARQFCGYILMVGRILSADQFDPKAAILLQNKDDLQIPLDLETIPSAQEFRDAIESLSPEQQRFAKAYRSLQLESTLFGIVIIQIKPQLEKLLNLPEDSLTKEIALTQKLLNLFIEYQIPSDLLSYDGPDHPSPQDKVDVVRRYANTMMDLINREKADQMKVAQQAQDLRLVEHKIIEELAYNSSMEQKLERMEMPMKKTKMRKKEMPMVEKRLAPSRNTSASKSAAAPPTPSKAAVSSPAPAPVVPSTPSLPSQPSATTPQPSIPEPSKVPSLEAQSSDSSGEDSQLVDYTSIPPLLETLYSDLDEDGALRPTIINPGLAWRKTSVKSLLASPSTSTLQKDEQTNERSKAFDLLHALTKSGGLVIDYAALHVVIASTHIFPKTIMNTIIQDNVNPIEKVERSSLILATAIHGQEAQELLQDSQIERIRTYSAPKLLTTD